MKRLVTIAAVAASLALAGTASAALVPNVFDPNNTGCVTSTYSNGVLHLAKNCATSTFANAGADITGFGGQTFTSASFTLASTSQCQGGSPRFNVVTSNGTFFLGCNNVTPTINANGTATYTFTAATLAAAGNQVPFPTGTIQSIRVLIDVQGTADVSNITVNGRLQLPVPARTNQCKHGGWRNFTPRFKNQGQCVAFLNHTNGRGADDDHAKSGSHGKSGRHGHRG
jgi:hypothetical protein